MYDFTGETVLVSGGSEGIGLAIGRAFAKQGAKLVIIGRDRTRLEKASDQLGPDCEAISMDLARPDAAEQIRTQLQHRDISPGILINNAGVARFATLEASSPELFDAHMNLNVRTPFLLTPHYCRGWFAGPGQ